MISFDGSTPTSPRALDRERTARVLDELTAASLVAQPAGGALLDDDDFLVSDETLDIAPAESPLRRYFKYQVRDFVQQRAAWLLAIGLLGLYFVWDNYTPGLRDSGTPINAAQEANRFRGVVLAMAGAFSLLASVFGVHGVVSAERERGLQRFLFAKPIARVPYYLQKLGIAFVGTLLLTFVMVLLASAVFGAAVPLTSAMLLATALFASVGGLAFLLSTLVRFEGGLALVATLGVIPLRAIAQDGGSWAWLGSLRFVLPPLERLIPLVEPGLGGDPLRAMLWAVGYGVLCVVGGVMVLRRRSILS